MNNAVDYGSAPGLGLSDFGFRSLHVPRLASILFTLAWLGLGMAAIVLFCAGLYCLLVVGGWGVVVGIVLMGGAPIVLLVGLLIIRILLEVAVLLFRIEANTRGQAHPR